MGRSVWCALHRDMTDLPFTLQVVVQLLPILWLWFVSWLFPTTVRGLNDPLEWVTPTPRHTHTLVPAKIVTAVIFDKETIGLQHTTRMARQRCMTPASLDHCQHRSVRCWCASIDLLSGKTASLSQPCQLYNREKCWLWSFCHWDSFPGCILSVLWLKELWQHLKENFDTGILTSFPKMTLGRKTAGVAVPLWAVLQVGSQNVHMILSHYEPYGSC